MSENISIIVEESEERKEDVDQMLEELFSIGKKRKPKKKVNEPTNYQIETLYTYKDMLDRLYKNIEEKDNMIIKQRTIVKQPIVHRISSKRTGWINFKECCNNLSRDSNHIQSFLESELACICSIDGNGFLVFKGIFQQKNIEIVLRKYINQFVQCPICKSIDTTIKKDQPTRICFIECSCCKSVRSVNYNIKK